MFDDIKIAVVVGLCDTKDWKMNRQIVHYDRNGSELLFIDNEGNVKLNGELYCQIPKNVRDAFYAMILDIGIYLRNGK